MLLIIGQSNSANFAARRYRSAHGDRVINFFGSRCHVAASPLIGADGKRGEPWTLLANLLVERNRFSRVVLVPAGIRSSAITRWAAGGDLNALLMSDLDKIQARYRITHVLWHQGESDFVLATPPADYRRAFQSLAGRLRGRGVVAPVYVSVATRCKARRDMPWSVGNPIAQTQRALVDPGRGIFAGIDSDALIGPDGRTDGCHFNQRGEEIFARAWLGILGE